MTDWDLEHETMQHANMIRVDITLDRVGGRCISLSFSFISSYSAMVGLSLPKRRLSISYQ